MINKIKHHKFFLHALRTALIFLAGFLSYELLKLLENEWNITHPNNKIVHFSQRKIYHFLIIFLIDLLILYVIALLFGVHL
jgi:hypothetical protein